MTTNKSLLPTKWDWRVSAALITICTLAGAVSGAETSFGEGSAKVFAERVQTAHTAEYQRVLVEFDTYLARFPDNSIASVERCKFIDAFAYSEDESIKTAFDDARKCEKGLRNGPNTESGAVKLYLWSTTAWEDSTAEGETLLKEYSSWTLLQQAALHEGLSSRYEQSDPLRAGDHATKAVGLDPRSGMRIRAAEHYIKIGAKVRAIATLQAMPAGDWNADTLELAVTMLLKLGETVAARNLVEENPDVELPTASRIMLAQSLLTAGETDAGRALAKKFLDVAEPSDSFGSELERKVFEFQLNHGSAEDANIAYRALRDKGFGADAFARHRLALTMTHWSAPWQLEDLTGIGALLLALAAVCMLPLVVIVPIHYRSVVKRLSGFTVAAAGPESPWSLRSVWYGLASNTVVGLIALYYFSYPDFEGIFRPFFDIPFSFDRSLDDIALGRAMFWSSVLSLLLLLPLLRYVKVGPLLLGKWSARRSIMTGIGFSFLLLMLNSFLTVIFGIYSSTSIGLGTDTVRSLQGIKSVYGSIGLLVCAAVIVPIVEEFLFRGVMLRSVARHLKFWVSVLVQAVIFTAWHESPAAFPFLFVFAIVNSLLAQRSGGLLAPVALHSLNNVFAVIAILKLTDSVGG